MRRILPLVLLLFLGRVHAADKIDADAIRDVVKKSLAAWDVPGASVAVVRGDEVVFLEGFGTRRVGEDKPVTPDTVFAIASCTKAFTATAIAALADEGKMSFDDPVRKHLPWFRLSDPLADAQVTVRDLLCHRTGLARHDVLWLQTSLGRDDLLRRVAFLRPSQPFRAAYQYNNLMYLAAGQAAAGATSQSWEDLVRSRLLDPLELKATDFGAAAAMKSDDHATPHRKTRDGKVEALAWQELDAVGPAGSMVSTARDMAKWVRFQLGDGTFHGKRIVSAANLEETHTPQMIVRLDGSEKTLNPETLQKSYGLGWLIQDYHGRLMVSHTGGLEGFRCRVVLMPRDDLGVVILTNSAVGLSPASMHVAATNTLVDLLLGLPKRDWDALYLDHVKKSETDARKEREDWEAKRVLGTKPSHPAEAYAGTYADPAYGSVEVTVKDGSLNLTWGRQRGTLKHFHYDTFKIQNQPRLEGEVVSFEAAGADVNALRFLGQTFRRVPLK